MVMIAGEKKKKVIVEQPFPKRLKPSMRNFNRTQPKDPTNHQIPQNAINYTEFVVYFTCFMCHCNDKNSIMYLISSCNQELSVTQQLSSNWETMC